MECERIELGPPYLTKFERAVIEAPEAVEKTDEGDELEIDLEKGVIKNLTKGWEVNFKPYPKMLMDIMKEGGIYEYVQKHGKFPWE